MRALRFHAAKDLRVDDVPVPDVKSKYVRVKPAFCGICGSDLHEYEDGPHLIPSKGAPHSLTGDTLPLTMGHEFSGVVDEVGEGVTIVKKGDKVAIQPTLYDEDCSSCTLGLTNCCAQFGFTGLSTDGGMSEYVNVPEYAIKKLPDDFPLDIGALVEPLAVGWHAVKASPYKEGDNVMILGGGPIGLSVLLALKAKDCKNIIVSEVSSKRSEFAKQFGAHHILNPTKCDIVKEVRALTGGYGVDVAYDAAGVQIAVDTALKAVRPRGTLLNIALWGAQRVKLDMIDMLFGERRYQAAVTYIDGDFEEVIEAIHSGKMKPEGMITKVIGLHEVAEEGFKTLVEDKDNQVKILIDISKKQAA